MGGVGLCQKIREELDAAAIYLSFTLELNCGASLLNPRQVMVILLIFPVVKGIIKERK